MKKRYWIFTSTLIAIVFLVEYDLSKRISAKASRPQQTLVKKQEAITAVAAIQPLKNVEAEQSSTESFFDSQLINEAQKISQLQSDPKSVDESIDKLAHKMNSLEIKKLAILIENKNENGDNRAMGVELLSRAQSEEAMTVLKDFVATHETGAGKDWNRNREFESVLRAQAIEGIAAYPQKDLALSYLNSLAQKVDESFLKDRIVRSEENLKGRAPPSQQQDETALKQLVQ
jgi:hypothetical protein